jgi:transmembrane 9 superfamily protein 2/4
MAFSILVGTGIQITIIIVTTLLLACLGYMAPHKRGIILKFLYLFLMLMSNVGGFFSARFYKMFNGTEWIMNGAI